MEGPLHNDSYILLRKPTPPPPILSSMPTYPDFLSIENREHPVLSIVRLDRFESSTFGVKDTRLKKLAKGSTSLDAVLRGGVRRWIYICIGSEFKRAINPSQRNRNGGKKKKKNKQKVI